MTVEVEVVRRVMVMVSVGDLQLVTVSVGELQLVTMTMALEGVQRVIMDSILMATVEIVRLLCLLEKVG